MKMYIRSSACISPQYSLETKKFFSLRISPEANFIKCREPDYDLFVDPKMIRRMSRIVRMGVAAAITCLREGGVEMPSAMITATAYGCLEDSASFLRRMIEFEEKMLSPTSFIQSTHNTVGAQIALMLKCHHYNNTIVHRFFSFENALIESDILLSEGNTDILLGAADEFTEDRHRILSRFGLYKKQGQKTGNFAGEGAAFFLLASSPGSSPSLSISRPEMIFLPENMEETAAVLNKLLSENALTKNDIGLVLDSTSGNRTSDLPARTVLDQELKGIPSFPFKSLCGDYPTAVSFGVWMAALILKEQRAPEWMKDISFPLQHILVYHHTGASHHSFILVSAA